MVDCVGERQTDRLDAVMGRDEEGSEAPEPVKVGPTIFVQFVGQVIEICHAIFDDPDPFGIKSLRTIEEVHDASADHCIQCHQWPLVRASHVRPPFIFVGFPERQHGIPIHSEDLQESSLTQLSPP